MKIIPATAEHMADCERIYACHVQKGVATFDETVPISGHLDLKRAFLQSNGFPFLVLMDEEVLSYFKNCCFIFSFQGRHFLYLFKTR